MSSIEFNIDEISQIILKHGITAGVRPNVQTMELGEVAVNCAKGDEQLFIKNTENELIALPLVPDYSDFVGYEEFIPVSTAALNSIAKNTLGLINGVSIEDGNDITLDLSLYKVVSALPTKDILDNKIYLVPNSTSTAEKNVFDEYVYVSTESRWEIVGQLASTIDLTEYIKTVDADKRYIKKGTNGNILVDSKGALSNFSDNGQAYLAVRPKTAKYLMNIPYAGASFGVKDDGTAAFTHKQYSDYNKDTGAYSGAKNTAVLQFAGPIGLRYAKNTGSASDVTEDMYRYVGVIDSPDEFQRVYSAKQVDDLLKTYTDEIAALKQAIRDLGGNI